jgi:uncharacterized OB-fold protein
MNKILPRPTETSAPYWQGCRERELRLQKCNACQRLQFYPRIMCSHCQRQSLGWIVATGRGEVASFTVVRRGVSEAYPTPYIVALIDLEEGLRMMSHVVGIDPESVAVGDLVKVEFEDWSDEITMPVFRVVSADQDL